MNADEIRAKMVAAFEAAKPTLTAFHTYSQTAAALAEEYHAAQFKETYPAVDLKELTLACSLDARETPATLDKKLAELRGITVKLVIFDRVHHTYYLFV